MADIRINALATTAASTASDDFIAVDGSANGTRKLNAYSPTFGGNLTVNGTDVKINNSTAYFYVDSGSSLTGMSLSRTNNILELFTANTARLTISAAGNTTLSGNLTVSGTGTNSFSGPIAISASGTDAAGFRAITTSSAQTGYVRVGADTASAVCDIGVGGSAHSLTAIRDKLYTYSNGAVRSTMDTSGNLVLTTGNLTVSGTGTSSVAGGFRVGSNTGGASADGEFAFGSTGSDRTFRGGYILSGSVPRYEILGANGAGSAFTGLGIEASTLVVNARSGGNLLIGTTTDSGNGKLQLATHTTSAGGIGFGANMSLYKGSNGTFSFDDTSGANDTRLFLYNNGTLRGAVEAYGVASAVYLGAASVGWSTYITSGNQAIALTLDSSQNATFAGTIKPQQAATASAPTYVKGAIYFDTTLNKLRVGGATGWETITSV